MQEIVECSVNEPKKEEEEEEKEKDITNVFFFLERVYEELVGIHKVKWMGN